MKRNEKITQIMTTPAVSVHLKQTLSEVQLAMAEGGFHHMPVVSGGKVVGLISSTDLLLVTYQYGQDPRQTSAVLDHTVKIEDLMVRDPVTLTSAKTVREAVEVLADGEFHSLPIVEDGKLVGMVTTTDVLRYMRAQY
jgi:CBS domain-containing protein